ncbi:hypothetical protein [Streptomyces sp. NPDC005859]|uniref:hypothetical protein n=1 Tax=Streptomyces sp. NPDC005859 TaxID=3157170 RepID=UPI0033D3B015
MTADTEEAGLDVLVQCPLRLVLGDLLDPDIDPDIDPDTDPDALRRAAPIRVDLPGRAPDLDTP